MNNDGHLEIVINGLARSDSEAYVAILMRDPDDTTNGVAKWVLAIHERDGGRYCTASRATFERNLVIADYLTCGGGTGIFVQTWIQKWIKCDQIGCNVIFQEAPLSWDQEGNFPMGKSYMIAKIETPDPETVVVTRERIQIRGVSNANAIPPDFVPPNARKIVGPKERVTYKWDGSTFPLVQEQQTSNETEIARENGPLSDRAVDTIHGMLNAPSSSSVNGSASFNPKEYEQAIDRFWGIDTTPPNPLYPHQKQIALTVAAQDIQPGNRIAAILASTNKVEFRLNVQKVGPNWMWPVFQIDLPCVPNFTRLEWLDIDGDKQDELLMLTLVNDVDGGAGLQRLQVFQVDRFPREISRAVGEINGADGVGIKWQVKDDRFDIYTGIAPSNIACGTFDCISLERRWRHIHLDIGSESAKQMP